MKSELFHQQVANNKVQLCELCRFIPKGRKVFITFKTDSNPCYIVEYYDKNVKKRMKTPITSINENMGIGDKGTVLFGTILYENSIYYMFIEDVYYFNSKPTKHYTWIQKYKLALMFMESTNRHVYCKNTIIYGLPITRQNVDTLMLEENNIPYPIYSIEFLQGYKKWYKKYNIKQQYSEKLIQADLQSDIYHVYDTKYIGSACIPDFKTSVLMNNYFRNIPENNNLDLIEESDDEDTFQDESKSKYVDLDKTLMFRCKMHTLFQKWIPIEYIGEK